jgi:hypothetical protein
MSACLSEYRREPYGEFGFIGIDQLPADRRTNFQLKYANNVPDL